MALTDTVERWSERQEVRVQEAKSRSRDGNQLNTVSVWFGWDKISPCPGCPETHYVDCDDLLTFGSPPSCLLPPDAVISGMSDNTVEVRNRGFGLR